MHCFCTGKFVAIAGSGKILPSPRHIVAFSFFEVYCLSAETLRCVPAAQPDKGHIACAAVPSSFLPQNKTVLIYAPVAQLYRATAS